MILTLLLQLSVTLKNKTLTQVNSMMVIFFKLSQTRLNEIQKKTSKCKKEWVDRKGGKQF